MRGPWLIATFIDPDAEILYVPADQVLEVAGREAALSFDAPGARYDHRDRKCTCEVVIDEHALTGDPALTPAGSRRTCSRKLHDELAGYVELTGGPFRRNRATAHLVIGVLAEASAGGVGAGLLQDAKRRAAAHGLHRPELTVMTHNRRAIGLYERTGFSVEGRHSECLLGGRFVDELYMAAQRCVPGAT
jgi:ribosomal protein S18 acetylase RimI-like enzyme